MKKIRTVAAALVVTGAMLLTGCGSNNDRGGTGGNATDANAGSTADTSALTQCLKKASDAVSLEGAGGATSTITPSTGFEAGSLIGVSLPQKTSQNWVEAEGMFNEQLTAAGYQPVVQFATNGVSDQQNQITAMITQGVKVLVVGAVDGSQLGGQLDQAKAAGVTVIAYDRLLMKTESIDMYVAYDNFKVGQLQGKAVVEGMMATQGEPPYNVELLAGSPDDANSKPFFEGGMSVIQPAIDCGAIKVLSGQTTQQQAATQGWLAANAQKRMDTILSANYTDAKLNGILSPNDTLARAAIASLDAAGKADEKTVISGQDSETASIPLIMKGTQYMTIYKDTSGLVKEIVKVIGELQKGQPVTVNDTETYDNGTKIVPTDLLTPILVTAENAKKVYANDPTREPCTADPAPAECNG
ncbi:MAG: sugar-binding protein [Propionibacteriaceae bacterium]|jgi:putative multiple sugar transport system substrate-binding protein|nr:sugar-binding protein [Propionibacteriaceae bacterium]